MIWKDFDWPVIESLKEDFNPGDNNPPGTQPGSSQLPTPLRCVPKTDVINSGGGNPNIHGHTSQGHLSQTNRTDKMDQPNVALASFLFYVLLPASLGNFNPTKKVFNLFLVTAVIFRYNFIGVIYLILLISWPFNAGIRRSYSKRFSLVVLIFSAFFNLITLGKMRLFW